ncbi:MAG TPA: sugar transferase [Chloroflexota bacterium]|nr:sugar transferase [Chloroflexota bacterium]
MIQRMRWPAWVVDALLVVLSLGAADQLRLHIDVGERLGSIQTQLVLPAVYPLLVTLWWAVAYAVGVYDRRTVHFLQARFSAWAVMPYGAALLVYLLDREIPRLLFLYLGVVSLILLVGLAPLLNPPVSPPRSRVALLGAGPSLTALAHSVQCADPQAIVVGYVIDGPLAAVSSNSLPVLGTTAQALKVVEEHAIDRVILVTSRPPRRDLIELAVQLRLKNVTVELTSDIWDLTFGARAVEEVGNTPLIRVNESPLSPLERRLKRLFDLVIAVPLLVISLPFLGLIALAIVIDSPSSPIFRQYRVGENGRLFQIIKFRTMVPDAEKLQEALATPENGVIVHKRRGDPRVTRIGQILRRTSLDELPQLFNVVQGNMSLVGPRPEMPWLVGFYEPWQFQRFTVPQGMTGWWQVNGRGDRPMHLHTEDDLYYIKHYSLFLDVKIILQTIKVVLLGRGAY